MPDIHEVELNRRERNLHDSICWGTPDEFMAHSHGERLAMFEALGELTESLLGRKAIPQARLDYFTDPELNFAGRKKSRMQVFEQNGTKGRDIFRHPHFMPYLQYFIRGPRLPKSTVEGLWRIIDDDAGTSGMVLDQIQAFVRKEVRDRKMDRGDVAEEFAKLALEFDRRDLAPIVRKAAMGAR